MPKKPPNVLHKWLGDSQDRLLKLATILATIVVSALGAASALGFLRPEIADQFAKVVTFVVAIIVTALVTIQRFLQEAEARTRTKRVERRYEENPEKPQAAWDLARVKLELYVERNLSQVQSVFWLTVVVIAAGFILIVYGVAKLYASPTAIMPALVTAGAGVLVDFIGASILVIYKSTMAQAKGYVAILERINAVGMAVQILQSLPENGALREPTTAEVVKDLLQLYTTQVKNPRDAA
jgi:TRADD-N domain-containing protein